MSANEVSESPWKEVGKVKEARGLQGELFILIFSKDVSWKSQLKEFKLGESLFQVQSAKAYKDGLIVKPVGIDDRNASEALKGSSFSIPTALFVSRKGETIYLSEILGFEVFDGETLVGPIQKFSSNGPQDLLVIPFKNREVEIPFVEAFIRKIDFEKRTVLMELPDGLLTLVEDEQ